MFSRLSTNKQYFMEPTKGMRYYEDVHRPIIDPYDETGDVCESESDTEASGSSETDQSVVFVASSEDREVVISPSKRRSTIARRAVPARKFTWLGREMDVGKKKKRKGRNASKRDAKAASRLSRTEVMGLFVRDARKSYGTVRKGRVKRNMSRASTSDDEEEVMNAVEDVERDGREKFHGTTFDEFMEGVRQAATSVPSAGLISDDDRDDVEFATERDEAKTIDADIHTISIDGVRPKGSCCTDKAPHNTALTDSEYEILFGSTIKPESKPTNSNGPSQESTRYKISPSKNSRSSITQPDAMRSPSNSGAGLRGTGLSKQAIKRRKGKTTDRPHVIDLAFSPTSKQRKHRGIPYRGTLRPASPSLDFGFSRDTILHSASRSALTPTAARAKKQRVSKRVAMKTRGDSDRVAVDTIGKAPIVRSAGRDAALGKRGTRSAEEKQPVRGGGGVANGKTQEVAKEQWVWFKNWSGERWMVEKSAGVVVIR
nr:hypothetical protein B0A51_05384 [Rachicladosporium sp. CCFEE 5018]